MVAKGLTRGDRMDAEVRREKRAIAAATDTPESTPVPAPESRQPARQKDATTAAAKRARAERLLRATPQMPLAEVAARSGVSERTASRIKSDLAARPLSAVR